MKHYNSNEWISYIDNLSNEVVAGQMEEHLISCEACLKQYIELLEEKEAVLKTIIPINFVPEVMNKINRNKVNNKKKIFVYYACAACVTLFLMGSGAFTILSKSIPIATSELIHSPAKIETSLGKINFNNLNFNFMNLFKTKL